MGSNANSHPMKRGLGKAILFLLALAVVSYGAVFIFSAFQQRKLVYDLRSIDAGVYYNREWTDAVGFGREEAPIPILGRGWEDFFYHPVVLEDVRGDDLTNDLMRRIGTLRHLESLTIYDSYPEGNPDLSFLSNLMRLDYLDISDPNAVFFLKDLPNLTTLSIDPGFGSCCDDLSVKGTKPLWTKKQRAALGGLTQIKSLHVTMTDEDMQALEQMEGLQDLNLYGDFSKGAGLVHLQNLKSLSALQLNGFKLVDENLKYLKGLHSLRSLKLNNMPISGAGLVYLRQLNTLNDIDLAGTRVDDDALSHLTGLKSLKSVNVSGTRVTAKGVERFKKLRPGVYVNF